MIPWLAFAVVSLFIVFFSRKSLLRPRSHGFFRFFAFELILALVALNAPLWFRRPFSPFQIVSWLLLFTALFFLAQGVLLLRKIGQPNRGRTETELFAFEKTSSLVTTGLYKRIRHPMYSSLLLLSWGAFLKNPSWIGAALAGFASLFLVLTAEADEAECLAHFGDEYQTYMGSSKMFIPYLF
jgi:protein-S-isoprenylcysteine O-methyltransferase Ste14